MEWRYISLFLHMTVKRTTWVKWLNVFNRWVVLLFVETSDSSLGCAFCLGFLFLFLFFRKTSLIGYIVVDNPLIDMSIQGLNQSECVFICRWNRRSKTVKGLIAAWLTYESGFIVSCSLQEDKHVSSDVILNEWNDFCFKSLNIFISHQSTNTLP